MKKLIVFIFATLFIVGCGKKEEQPVSKDNSVVDTSGVLQINKDNAPPSNINLVYKFPKNSQIKYRLTSISNSTQAVVAETSMTQLLKQNISYVFNMDITDVDADNIMDIKVTIPSIKVDADANGQKFHYQSGTKLDSLEKLKYLEYESVVNNPFYIRLEPKGDIIEIYRVDKIANKFLELQGIKDSVSAEQKKQFQTNISESALRPLLQQIFRSLPTKQLAKDSIWTHKYVTRLGIFQIENTAIYTLKDFGLFNNNHIAMVNAGLEIKTSGKNKVSNQGINYEFGKPVANGDGTIYFNIDKGRVEKSKTRTTLKMTMKMNIPKSPRGPVNASRNDFVENINIVELL